MSASAGIRPTVIAICRQVTATTARITVWAREPRSLLTNRPHQAALASKIATAPNESQKPLASSAQGSSNTAITATALRSREADNGMRRNCAAPITASIRKVRRAGTPQPANRQYSQAIVNATIAAAMRAGIYSDKPTVRHDRRRQSQKTTNPPTAAIIVIWLPLMLTRWVIPLRLKMVQSLALTLA